MDWYVPLMHTHALMDDDADGEVESTGQLPHSMLEE